jgi:hypothetical protein
MCNCNNTTNCGGGCLGQTPCQTPDCSCAVQLSSDCINNVTAEMPCSAITQGQTLTAVLEQLDAFICVKFNQTVAFFTLINVGAGSQIYKGVNGVGQKEIRSIITTGTLLTNVQNTNDITLTINEANLITFLQTNQKTYTLANVGTGAQIYKDATVVLNNTQYNVRTIVKEDLGTGTTFLRDIQQNTNELNLRVKTLVSDNLTITSTDDEVRIETPTTASIPALYVNNLYTPTYNEWLTENKAQNAGVAILGFVFRGKGSLAQPFTDNIVYPLLGGSATITNNTAIQNALDGDTGVAYTTKYSYQGTGTRLAPQRIGQTIIIQNNNGSYTHAGEYNYENIKLRVQGNVNNTTSNYFIDMDNASFFNVSNGRFEITIEEGVIFEFTDSLGVRNSGNTSSTPPSFDTGRVGAFLGKGTLYFSYSGASILTRYIFNGDGNNNDDNLHFQVECKVRADQQGIYFTKNKMRIDFYNLLQSGILAGSGNIALKAFHMTGGQVRFYEEGAITLQNGTTGRTYGITFEPTDDGIGYCNFQLNSGRVAGNSQSCFVKLNDEDVGFLAFNSPSGDGFATTLVGTNTVTEGLFENLGVTPWEVNFKNNVFSFTGIDQTKVDLTAGNATSVINFIGNSVLENLVIYDNRADAILAGIPLYSAYLKTNGTTYPTTATWVRDIVLPA